VKNSTIFQLPTFCETFLPEIVRIHDLMLILCSGGGAGARGYASAARPGSGGGDHGPGKQSERTYRETQEGVGCRD